ncbi:MAG: 4-alpha-glucanotransferase, partial [Treponema sp.]|nr:4-alpha-glucanotransferase [Treponema sp.]
MYESRRRYCGILLPVSSLPGPRGIGDLGGEARAFADFLSAALVTHWQILPLGPTGYGNSPYAARSAFAGNELLIDLEDLAARGFLEKRDLEASRAGGAGRIDYGLVASSRLPPLKKAARAFLDKTRKSADDGSGISSENFGAFCEKEAYWLDDYSLFQVLYEKYGDARWHSIWDGAEARRDPRALERVRSENKNKILEWKALQFFFECQWRRLKAYVNARGIAIIGDIPIFVAPDSADSWSRPDLLQMDTNGRYAFVSGVPPDYFSVTGQLWGNPVYDWEAMRAENYRWWKARIRRLMEQVDLFRIDHFRGFDEYWAVPAAAVTAETGEWKKGPGNGFFAALKAELGPLPVIAEDLGFMTESVALLRESQGFPGMKVCQFGFEDMRGGALDARHLFLPHNYGYLWAAYTGTH